MSPKTELWVTVASIVAGSLIFLYSTFLTRAEANDRRDARDKTERLILDAVGRIETKLDTFLGNKK